MIGSRNKKTDHASLVDQYLRECEGQGLSPETTRNYGAALRAWLASGQEPRDFLLALAAAGRTKSTVNQRRSVLHAYFAWGVDRQLLDKNDMDAVRPMRNRGRRFQRVLTIGEIAALLEGCEQLGKDKFLEAATAFGHLPVEAYRARLAAMVAVQVTAGLRVTELCTIKRSDVQMRERRLTVIGKGDKERAVRFGLIAKDKLEAWEPFRVMLPGDYLFCGRDGQAVQRRTYARQLDAACWWAGIDPINPHLLRHTFATMAIESKIPVADVQEMLGHANISTTMRYVQGNEGAWESYGSHPLDGDAE